MLRRLPGQPASIRLHFAGQTVLCRLRLRGRERHLPLKQHSCTQDSHGKELEREFVVSPELKDVYHRI